MILFRNDHWLAITKPYGMATHAPEAGELGAVEWLKLHLDETVHVISRLDRGTSGVLLLARNAAASAEAQKIHESEAAGKTYEFLAAIPEGAEVPESWTCQEPLDGKPARTRFQRLGVTGINAATQTLAGVDLNHQGIAHFRAEISRGRRHQIRRHAAAAGLPLLGDKEHGGSPWPRLCLHCTQVRWPGIDSPLQSGRPDSFRLIMDPSASIADLERALCHERRGSWPAAITDAWRLIHRDELARWPLAVDRYGEFFNAVWFDEGNPPEPDGELDEFLLTLARTSGCRGGVLRSHRRNPHQRTLVTEKRILGESPPEVFTVTEHGLNYEIDLQRTQHTGLFLDQRDTRRRVARQAGGARLANLFAFTCSFSVAAVARNAEVAFSVDVARPCLNTGKANFEWNHLTESGRGKFVQEDVRRWLQRQLRRREADQGWSPLDLIVCDPPVFASSKDGGRFSLEKEWPQLASAAARLLAADGEAIFANNHRSGDDASYRRALRECFGQVVALRPPLDFPVLPGRPPHVRIYACRQPSCGRPSPSRPH